MFDAIIHASLKHRALVLAAGVLLIVGGSWRASRMPLDVLPELAAPSVTVVTEANGLAPEEVEQLVTVPLEHTLNGASGVRRLRSSSSPRRGAIRARVGPPFRSPRRRRRRGSDCSCHDRC